MPLYPQSLIQRIRQSPNVSKNEHLLSYLADLCSHLCVSASHYANTPADLEVARAELAVAWANIQSCLVDNAEFRGDLHDIDAYTLHYKLHLIILQALAGCYSKIAGFTSTVSNYLRVELPDCPPEFVPGGLNPGRLQGIDYIRIDRNIRETFEEMIDSLDTKLHPEFEEEEPVHTVIVKRSMVNELYDLVWHLSNELFPYFNVYGVLPVGAPNF